MNNPRTFSFIGYAQEYGTFIGLVWSIASISYCQGLQYMSSLLILLGFLLALASPFIAIYFGHRFKKRIPGELTLSYPMSYIFSLQMLMFASLLLGIVEFLYFNFIDHGELAASLLSYLNKPEITNFYKQMNMSDMLQDAKQTIEAFSALPPLQIALGIFDQSVMGSLILAVILAFFVKKQGTKNNGLPTLLNQ